MLADFKKRRDLANRLLTLTHPCDWCDKPKSEWTNTMNWRNQRKHYCSMECYSAGEYKMNRYLCALPPIILGLAFIFLISVLLSDITTVTIIAIPILIVIWAVFSSLSFAFIIVGRLKRIERESEEGEV